MAVAIDTPWVARNYIPEMQRELDREGEDGRHFQIHRVSVHAMILSHSPENWRRLYSAPEDGKAFRAWMAKQEALDWQADPDDDLSDAAVYHHLCQQAVTVPLLSSAISEGHHDNAVTSLTGSALSASINARTQGRPLSSFDRRSYRLSSLLRTNFVIHSACAGYSRSHGIANGSVIDIARHFLYGLPNSMPIWEASRLIVWADSQSVDHTVFLQVEVDMVDLSSRRFPNSSPRRRQGKSLNQFLQVSHSPGVEDTSRRNPLPHAEGFNGVRYRRDRKTWVAEMKPPKHKTKQDFGNFKSDVEAARAVDAAYHYYGRPELLNFPHPSLQFLSKRPAASAGLDQQAMVKFVKKEAKLLLAAVAAPPPLYPTRSNSLQIQELSPSPRQCPPGPFRSVPEISSPFPGNGLDEVDAVVSPPQPWMLHDPICDISTTEVLTDLGTLNSEQNAEQGWDWADDSSALAAPPNIANPSASENTSTWPDYIVPWSPAPIYPISPTPSLCLDEIEYGSQEEHQSIWVWSDAI